MTIDLVIPTLWRSPSLLTSLQHYEACPQIARIILIDNEPSSRPAQLALTTGKLQVLSQKRNIFVNPAWNLGVKASTAPIVCLLNDDIEVQPEVFSFVTEIDWITRQIDIIGILLGECYVETILQRIKPNKQSPLGSQVFSFGACMFLQRRSYIPIPEDLQVWFGDDYLTHHNDGVFLLSTPHISGSMSKTIKSFPPNSPLHDAIAKDIEYAQSKLGIVSF